MTKSQVPAALTFGDFFRARRIGLGLTLRTFSERFGYDPGNISRLERNILSPSLNDEKLAGYAIALQIKKDSEEWVLFHDLAHTAKGSLPKDILKNPQILSVLPAFYRTARGEKLDKNKIKALIRLLNKVNGK
jgi:transcriptional regulator with XRE-family HTH domain